MREEDKDYNTEKDDETEESQNPISVSPLFDFQTTCAQFSPLAGRMAEITM